MGYFPNGTEGADYQERYCFRCVHWDDEGSCPVWELQLEYNGADEPCVEAFIPIVGLGNGQCRMFLEKAP